MATPAGLPDFLVIGAPKSGTTTLADWLAVHPDVFVAAGKEVRFFNLHHDRGEDWYRSCFAAATPGQRRGEATPAYLYLDVALDRIRALVPDVRLVAILREPVARAWSHYWFNRGMGIEPRSFTRALDAERAGPPLERATSRDLVHAYLGLGRYADRLDAVDARFAADQLLVVLADDLRRDPADTFATVCRHIGVAPRTPEDRTANVGAAPRSHAVSRLLRVLRSQRWPAGLGRRVAAANRRGGYPPIDAALAARLRASFAADNARLAQRLGRVLPDAWEP